MKIVDLTQNSKDWYAWRRRGLGASDAPIVMNDSPWTSRFMLWAMKTELMQQPEPDVYAAVAMKRGHDLEPVARACYMKKTGLLMTPITGTHDQHEFIRASLDGWNADEQKILEIKCPSKVDHAKAVKGKIPEKYIPQLQHQFLVTGAKSCDYFSFDGTDGVIVPVLSDESYQKVLLAELIKFWELIEKRTPPEIEPEELVKVVKMVSAQAAKLHNSMNGLTIIAENLFNAKYNKGAK